MIRAAMMPEDVAAVIVHLPRTLQASGVVSIYDLAVRAGYFDVHERVDEPALRKALRAVPDLVEDWLAYSDDKRAESGWYVRRVPNHGYEVGHYGGIPSNEAHSTYTDKFTACAKFIKHEMEAMHGR